MNCPVCGKKLALLTEMEIYGKVFECVAENCGLFGMSGAICNWEFLQRAIDHKSTAKEGHEMKYPCISIKQPWAYAILHLGKDVENRTWPIPAKFEGERVLIHAGKNIDMEAVRWLRSQGYDIPKTLPVGCIVGCAYFGNDGDRNSEWAEPDMQHWSIKDARELALFRCRGQLGFFEVEYPEEVPK
jgi:hypothetical protein